MCTFTKLVYIIYRFSVCVRGATAVDDAEISTACDATAATVAGPAGVDRWLLQIINCCKLLTVSYIPISLLFDIH